MAIRIAINVGKADALLLCCGNSTYLIDTGTKESYEKLHQTLGNRGINRLTGVILTHTDKDHAGGLISLLRSGIEIENVYASRYFNKKVRKHPAIKALRGSKKEVIFVSSGDTLPLDGGKLTVLGPLEPDAERENNNSLVLLAEGAGGSILLTGDMEFPEEESLLAANLIPHADILKVGNHGDGDATSQAFIETVNPSVAVISTNTGEKADTPDSRIIRMLTQRNIQILQTQDSSTGVLILIKDGQISTEIQ